MPWPQRSDEARRRHQLGVLVSLLAATRPPVSVESFWELHPRLVIDHRQTSPASPPSATVQALRDESHGLSAMI